MVLVNHIHRIDAVFRQQLLDLLVELHRRQVVRHRHIIESVPDHDVVSAMLKFRYLHARVIVVHDDARIAWQPQVFLRDLRNCRVYLDDLLVALRIGQFKETRHRVAATADVQRAELRLRVPYHRCDVREYLLVAVHEEGRVVQIDVAVNEPVERECPDRAPLYLALPHLDAEVVALHLALGFERIGRKSHSGDTREQHQRHSTNHTHPPQVAEHHRHNHKEHGDAKQNRARANPLDKHEAGDEHAKDATCRGYSVYLAHHVAGLRQVAQPQLDDHRRYHAKYHARHEE